VGSGTPIDRVPDAQSAARAAGALIALRAGYAYNWFDIGPAFPNIGATFAVGAADWGLLIAAFLVGAGLFQVPAGLLARRYGARTISLTGGAVLAAGAALSAVAPSFAMLVAARFGAGVGAGLFFSPAIGLIAGLFPPGHRGLPVGAFSSTFSGGAAAGVFATAVLVPVVQWRVALALGAAGLLLLTLLATALVPRSAGNVPTAPAIIPGQRSAALRFRGVWAIGLAFTGFEGAAFATGQFIVPFGEALRGWSAAVAGGVGTMFVLPSLAGGPVGGPVAERRTNHRTQLVLVTATGAVMVALIPFAGLAEILALGAVFSFAYGFVYAVMYVVPNFWPAVRAEEIPLAIGLFNALQLAGGAGFSFLFGWLVANFSYFVAWEALALIQAATLVALVALPRSVSAGPRAGEGFALPGAHGP
jgi:MFS transporter, ACDE family, multidrug resistance protein